MTPRCFAAWSKGRAEAAKHRADDNTMLAWRFAQFSRATKKLHLGDYLISRQERAQTADEMLAVLQTFREGGAPINISKLN